MKKFGFIAYTLIFKSFVFILLTVFAWLSGSQIVGLFTIHIENPAAFNNAFIQRNNFDYASSEYAERDVRDTIDNVMDYSLKYMKDYDSAENGDKEDYDYYMRLSNEGYKETAEFLEGLEGVTFAVVNHGTGRIVSNIEEIDGKSSGTEIRSFFGDDKSRSIIIRSCKNPYFEQDTMTDYVDYVRQQASQYSDNCDLYIYFGDGIPFKENIARYEAMHFDTLDRVSKELNLCVLYSAIAFVSMITLFIVVGKAEKNGKAIPSMTDPIPNDLLFVFLAIIGGSATVLLYNSFYMLYKSSTLDSYGLGFSPEFYALRANICFIAVIWTLCAFICKLRQQRNLGTLATNTYVYKGITLLRDMKNANNTQES